MAVLLDTGVFFGLYDTKDSNHDNSVGLVGHSLMGKWGRVFVSNYVSLETTLLLGSKIGGRRFLECSWISSRRAG